MAIFTNELEQVVLGGILNNSDLYIQHSNAVRQDLFAHEINALIFEVIARAHNVGDGINRVVLVNKLKNTGITFADKGIEIGDYCDIISRNKPDDRTFKETLKELTSKSMIRFASESCDTIKKNISKGDMSAIQVQEFIDKHLYRHFEKFASDDDVIYALEGAHEYIEECGNNPNESTGLKVPYSQLGEMAPIAKNGEIFCVCSRSGHGKSTILSHLTYSTSVMNDVPAIIVDTEMQHVDSRTRLAAMISGIPVYSLESGEWRNVPEYVKIVRSEEFKQKMKYKNLYFKFIPDCDSTTFSNVMKKWYYTKVGRGNQCVIDMDYIKITEGEGAKAEREFQAMGQKVHNMKTLISKDIKAPMFTAVQMNRSTMNDKGHTRDDFGSIGGSDRIIQYVSVMGIFRRKHDEEIAEEGRAHGTHKFLLLKTRHQGRKATGHNEFIKANDGRFVRNFINFEVDNFNVKEVSSGEDMYKELAVNSAPQKKQNKRQDDKESF